MRQVDFEAADRAVTGWANDRLHIGVSGDDVIFAYLFAGVEPADSRELAETFQQPLEANLAPGAYGSVRLNAETALVLAASDSTVRDRLDELFTDFGEEVFATTP